jgi:small neutral amino acid transporter SnatA (MarC family)
LVSTSGYVPERDDQLLRNLMAARIELFCATGVGAKKWEYAPLIGLALMLMGGVYVWWFAFRMVFLTSHTQVWRQSGRRNRCRSSAVA